MRRRADPKSATERTTTASIDPAGTNLGEDTAPFPVPVEYVAKRPPFQLRVWNVWQGPHGATMALIANAGMIVEEQQPGLVILGCSAGPGVVRPADSRIRLSWSSDVAARVETPAAPSP